MADLLNKAKKGSIEWKRKISKSLSDYWRTRSKKGEEKKPTKGEKPVKPIKPKKSRVKKIVKAAKEQIDRNVIINILQRTELKKDIIKEKMRLKLEKKRTALEAMKEIIEEEKAKRRKIIAKREKTAKKTFKEEPKKGVPGVDKYK